MIRHHRKKNNQQIILIVVVAVLFLGGLIWLVKGNSKPAVSGASAAEVQALAQCLTDKGVKMYGASRCPHCKAQKELFGAAFAKIDYVECTTEQVKCNIAGVSWYPTRTYQGQKYEGEQTFEKLAKITSCPYNGATSDISGSSSIAK